MSQLRHGDLATIWADESARGRAAGLACDGGPAADLIWLNTAAGRLVPAEVSFAPKA
jgi:hypothetical protein